MIVATEVTAVHLCITGGKGREKRERTNLTRATVFYFVIIPITGLTRAIGKHIYWFEYGYYSKENGGNTIVKGTI